MYAHDDENGSVILVVRLVREVLNLMCKTSCARVGRPALTHEV